ncbi:MAG: hypothetical protein II310_00315, partial [Selenomonadaceae bacterium]|nr:hypothetical protein [Selenomonadaceae bacterium]
TESTNYQTTSLVYARSNDQALRQTEICYTNKMLPHAARKIHQYKTRYYKTKQKRFQWERINTKNKRINAIEIMSIIMGKNKQLYKYETSMDR